MSSPTGNSQKLILIGQGITWSSIDQGKLYRETPRLGKGGFRKATAQYEKGHGQSRFNPSGLPFLHVIMIPKVVFSFPPGYRFSKTLGHQDRSVSRPSRYYIHTHFKTYIDKSTNSLLSNSHSIGSYSLAPNIWYTQRVHPEWGFVFSLNIEQT